MLSLIARIQGADVRSAIVGSTVLEALTLREVMLC